MAQGRRAKSQGLLCGQLAKRPKSAWHGSGQRKIGEGLNQSRVLEHRVTSAVTSTWSLLRDERFELIVTKFFDGIRHGIPFVRALSRRSLFYVSTAVVRTFE
jgi:hypothetical protein